MEGAPLRWPLGALEKAWLDLEAALLCLPAPSGESAEAPTKSGFALGVGPWDLAT